MLSEVCGHKPARSFPAGTTKYREGLLPPDKLDFCQMPEIDARSIFLVNWRICFAIYDRFQSPPLSR